MINHKVSLRYAASLLESSLEKKTLETVSKEVQFVYDTVIKSHDLNRMLNNPVIKAEVKLAVLTEIFKGKINPELMSFISFILQKGREDQLTNILHKFIELRDEQLGIENVTIVTAFDFTDEQTELLRKKFEQRLDKKVRLKFTIDQNMIGGFIAKVKDTVYDASVRHQLELLKKEFLGGGASLN
jgi:F-type H+-transporting ATPase subunit delta